MTVDKLGMDKVLESVIHNAEIHNQPEDGDYYDEDGFLVCGKCNTRREMMLVLHTMEKDPPPRKVRVMCKCRQEQEKAEKERIAREREMEAIAALKQQSLMDDRLSDATFSAFVQRSENARILKICRRYAEHFDVMLMKNQGLLFYGDVGTGKTYAAACIANYLLERRVPVVMTSFVKLMDSMMGFQTDDSKLIDRLNKAKLLVIDDLGAERGTDTALEKVYNIVDSRYRARKPVILTTNLSIEEMKDAVDRRYARIYDRIFEMCYPMRFSGISWRKREASRRFTEMKELLEGFDG